MKKVKMAKYVDPCSEPFANGNLAGLQDVLDAETFNSAYSKRAIFYQVFHTTLNATKLNHRQVHRDIVSRILSMQSALLDRIDRAILFHTVNFDQRGHFPDIPDFVEKELLPRYGKIAQEIAGTIKLLRKLDDEPTPALPATPTAPAPSSSLHNAPDLYAAE